MWLCFFFFTLLDHKPLSWKSHQKHQLMGNWGQTKVQVPERGFEDLPRRALFAVVVVAVEKVPKHSLVCRDVCHLDAVDSLGAGLRQRQARPSVWTTLIVFDTPEVTAIQRFSLRVWENCCNQRTWLVVYMFVFLFGSSLFMRHPWEHKNVPETTEKTSHLDKIVAR